jgi:hypothetical protein
MIQIEIDDKMVEFKDDLEFQSYLNKNELKVDADGNIYKDECVGVIPRILDLWFSERVEYRKLAAEYGKAGDKEQEAFYDRRQKRQKIFLNSVYGTLGLPVFRFYDRDNAEAVTLSGQEIIRSAERLVNSIYLDKFAEKGMSAPVDDFVVYIDTDSLYFSSLPMAQLDGKTDNMTQYTIEFVQMVAKKINQLYDHMVPRVFNVAAKYNRIRIVPDVVAKTAMWVVKKRYAMLKVFDMEKMKEVKTKDGKEGKLEVKGIDVVRSSFPAAFRRFAGDMLESILRGVPRAELDERILKFEEEIDTCSMNDLCKTSSVKFVSGDGMINYNPPGRRPFQFVDKSSPQVKGSLAYNDLLKLWKLDKQYETISHSAKIKWAYLLPNDFCLEQLAFKADDTDPDQILEFISNYIDRRKMYDRELKSKLSEIYRVIRWDYPSRGSQIASKVFNFNEEW